jgi:glycerophosphoryl diester phosphodiesterase
VLSSARPALCGALLAVSLLGAEALPAAPVAVIAHRGEHLRHPENTLPAVQAAIELGADFVEIDVRTSADGQLVLMHDQTVNRTTNGRGWVASMTFDQLRALDAGVRFRPEFAGVQVPSFDEVLELARGRIAVYVDAKRVAAEDLVAALERHEMLDHAVVYGNVPLLRRLARLRPALRVMPEALQPRHLRLVLQLLPVRVLAFDSRDFSAETLAIARRAGAEIFVDRLGRPDSPEGWRDAIARGASGIQTNHPRELIEYLRSAVPPLR